MFNLSPLRKITLVLISSSLVAISLLVFYLHHSLRQSTVSQWIENNAHSVRQLAAWIDHDLEQAQTQLRHMSLMPEFQKQLDAELINPNVHGIPLDFERDKRQILEWSLLEHEFSVLFLLLPDGRFYLAHPFSVQQKLTTDTLAQRAYFQQAKRTKQPVLSDSFVGADGLPAVAIDIPIVNDQDQIIGHLGGVFHLASLARFFPKSLSNIADERFLLDRTGQLVTDNSDDPASMAAILNSSLVRNFIESPPLSSAESPYPIATAYLPVTPNLGEKALILARLNNGWTIGVSTSVDTVVAHFIPYISRTAGLAALLLMVIGIIGIAFAHQIGRRWQAAEQEIRAARNELEIRVLLRTTELGEKEERLRTTLQSIGDAVIATTTEGNIFSMNPVAEQLTGWPLAEAQGKPLNEIFHISHAQTNQELTSPVERVLRDGQATELEQQTMLIAKNGARYRIADSAAPIRNDQGRITGAVLVFRDVSEDERVKAELIQSEQRFRSIFQTSMIGMIVVQEHNVITEWNLGAERIFGYPQEQIVGQSIDLLLPERYRQNPQEGFKLAVRNSRSQSKAQSQTLTGMRKSGEEFPLELTLGSWEKDGVIYYNAIILDITERKQAEHYLRRSQKMQAVGQLSGGIAHDFNNILSIILGNLSLLKLQLTHTEKLSPEKINTRIETIENSAQRAVDLTKQLLRFSSNKPANVTLTNLNQVINDMTHLISGSLTPEIMVEHKAAEPLWFTEIDAGDFGDALLNLIINARDAMLGRGKLMLETANFLLEDPAQAAHLTIPLGHYVRLTVSDTGTGIPRELQERIFEPFFTTKKSGKGTGLGLAMVYGFIQRSKGYIRLYSELGIGSTFKLYLPRANTDRLPTAIDTSQNTELPQGTGTILVVDDELKLREMAAEMLRVLGYQVLTASDASNALAVLAQNPQIVLLFSDIVMPGEMNGYELAAAAMASYPGLKVLLTSGYTGKAAFTKQPTMLPTEVLNKPYAQAELAQRISALLTNH